ncbi:conserved membrane hypothetical protein [Tenacibaculum sp. 190524A05c]
MFLLIRINRLVMFTLNKYWSRFNFIIIPALLFLSLIVLLKSGSYSSQLSNYIIIDFLITIPLCYFFLIRKKEIPKITIVSVFIIGTITASLLIPKEDQSLLDWVKDFILPVLELGVLSFVIYKARLIFKSFKKKKENLDFYDAIQIATKEILPEKVAHFLATELTVFYYVFFDWKKLKPSKNSFTYTKEGTYSGVLLGLILVVVIETSVLHVLVSKWNVGLAWFLSIVSVYTLLQLVALFKSMLKRPLVYNEENRELLLRFGFAGFANVSINNIEKIELTSKEIEDDTIQYFSFLGKLCGHNTIIHFKEPVEFESIYGIKKEAKSLALIVDDKQAIVNLISE